MAGEFKIDWLTKFTVDDGGVDLSGGITTGGLFISDECVLGDPAPDILGLSLQLRLDASWESGEEIELYVWPRMESGGIYPNNLYANILDVVTTAATKSALVNEGALVHVHKNATDLTAHLENIVVPGFEFKAYSVFLGILCKGSGAVAADGGGENNVAYIHKGVYQYQSS